MLYFEFLIDYCAKNKQPKLVTKHATHNIVLIDGRANPLSLMAVAITLSNIDNTAAEWGCKVLTSSSALKYYEDHLRGYGAQVFILPALDSSLATFDIDVYNGILKDSRTWEIIAGSKALIIQDDGMLVRPGVEEFMSYDYVGAPWLDAPGNAFIKAHVNPALVGNGGFSLRDVPRCKHITEKYDREKRKLFFDNQVEIPEDVYFVDAMVKEGFKVAPTSVAARFAVEQTNHLDVLGFHKPWAYHLHDHTTKLFKKMLQ